MAQNKIYGRVLDINSLKMLKEKRQILFFLSFIIHNTKPVGHQVAFDSFVLFMHMLILVLVIVKVGSGGGNMVGLGNSSKQVLFKMGHLKLFSKQIMLNL